MANKFNDKKKELGKSSPKIDFVPSLKFFINFNILTKQMI